MSKNVKAATLNNFTPTRIFFRVSTNIPTIYQAREIFRVLGEYGNMVEYRFTKCEDTLAYLRHGSVIYDTTEAAQKVIAEKYIKVPISKLFKAPTEIKVEKAYNVINESNYRLEKRWTKEQVDLYL